MTCMESGKDSMFSKSDENNDTSLMKFCKQEKCHFEIAEQFINEESNLNAQNKQGDTALILACGNENIDEKIIYRLIEKGANPNIKNKDGFSPLLKLLDAQSIYSYSLNIVKFLIKNGANVNEKTNDKRTALMIICEHYYVNDVNLQIVKELINYGIDINAQFSFNCNALDSACSLCFNDSHVEIIKELLKNGIKILKSTVCDYSVLHKLIENDNHYSIIEYVKRDDSYLIDKKYVQSLINRASVDSTIIHLLCNIYRRDTKIMVKLLPCMKYEDQLVWYNFISNNTTINKHIVKHRKHIYEKPGNIISLCAEANFNISQQNKFVPNKINFLFDLCNQSNYKEKIDYYLQEN